MNEMKEIELRLSQTAKQEFYYLDVPANKDEDEIKIWLAEVRKRLIEQCGVSKFNG